ncbi:MAG: YesL family protein [Bacillota bacterium]
MKVQYGRFFTVAERFSNLFFLNMLWLAACLPIFTILPSTAAMFGVYRDWATKEETSIFRPFLKKFKENFRQSIVLQIAWTTFSLIVYFNFSILNHLDGILRTTILTMIITVAFFLLTTTIYMLTVMVHYDFSLRELWKNSFLVALTSLPTTFMSIMILLAAGILTYMYPVLFVMIFSVTAFIVFSLCFRIIRVVK